MRLLQLLRKFKNKKKINEDKFNRCVIDTKIKNDLVVFDDFLPSLMGSWRSIEIATYMQSFENTQLICFLEAYPSDVIEKLSKFEFDKKSFIDKYGLQHIKEKIMPLGSEVINMNASLAYCLFYNNLKQVFHLLKINNISFVFTLYPGGGFNLYNQACEDFLKMIHASPLFKGVIVTQLSVKEYLVNRLFFEEGKIKFIYGCPLELARYQLTETKKYYGFDKKTLDICFVASKYITAGLNKGFDVFCKVASHFSHKYDFIKFHVVGEFTEADLLYPSKENSITFYGLQYFEWFKAFYVNIDIIISPVRSNVVAPGSFDGFPTGAVIDAGLFGAAMMTADPTGDNVFPQFVDEEEIFLIESNFYSVAKKIEALINCPEKIKEVSEKGKKKLQTLFNESHQLKQRKDYLKNYILEQ